MRLLPKSLAEPYVGKSMTLNSQALTLSSGFPGIPHITSQRLLETFGPHFLFSKVGFFF